MIKDHQRFNNISSGIQNLALTLAIIIGGLWTAFTFTTLETKYKAQADITQLELANARTKVELAEKGAVLDIKLDAKQEFLTDNDGYCIAVVAKITNTGVKNTFVDLSREAPLTAYLVSFNDDGTSVRSEVVTQGDYSLSKTTVRSGYTIELPQFIKVKFKGLYTVEFKIKLDKNEILIDSATRGEKAENPYWTGKAYVLIK
jgi:hypothetical protein